MKLDYCDIIKTIINLKMYFFDFKTFVHVLYVMTGRIEGVHVETCEEKQMMWHIIAIFMLLKVHVSTMVYSNNFFFIITV